MSSSTSPLYPDLCWDSFWHALSAVPSLTEAFGDTEVKTRFEKGITAYFSLLSEANTRLNLMRWESGAQFLTRHVLDALTLLPWLPTGTQFIDIGCGGGVPLFPVLLARPDLKATGLEATQKKVAALREFSESLGLTGRLTLRAERSEDVIRAGGLSAPVVTARAVSALKTLVPMTAPLLAPGGTLLAMKGRQAEAELAEARSLLRRYRLKLVGLEAFPDCEPLAAAVLVRLQKSEG